MKSKRGAALVETLVASVILVSGVVAVASIFSFTTGATFRNRQTITATMLLYDKMEQLRTMDSPAGGSLDPANPVADFSDNPGGGFLRVWQIQDSGTPTITIAVFASIGPATPQELARATGPR
jgi:Tfp pilus assembly protein PilV